LENGSRNFSVRSIHPKQAGVGLGVFLPDQDQSKAMTAIAAVTVSNINVESRNVLSLIKPTPLF
jgi:hypothetical protein